MILIIQRLGQKIKGGIEAVRFFKTEWLLGVLIFLMVTFAFGLGWFAASQNIGRAPIIINCPVVQQ